MIPSPPETAHDATGTRTEMERKIGAMRVKNFAGCSSSDVSRETIPRTAVNAAFLGGHPPHPARAFRRKPMQKSTQNDRFLACFHAQIGVSFSLVGANRL
jgi:hypothetical protein